MTQPEDALNVRGRSRHRTVDRIAAILELVARSRTGLTLSGMAKELDAPISSTQGLVNGLVATGYLEEHERRYSLGSAPYLLNRLAGRQPVSTVTHADLEDVHASSGLTTVLSIAVGPNIFYVDYCSSDPRFAYLAENYVRRSLIRTSGGWILLAGMEKRDLWAYIQTLPDEDRDTVERFFAALPEIEQTGICASPNESTDGDGVSVAVRENGKTVAAVGVIAPHTVITKERDRLVALLEQGARSWSDRSVRP
ncbi:helix-turn-helix domain-containing protein [Rhodococcus opacus]|nr:MULTISPECIES: helix-turn-helix domain-containing protein [Rhodococcus]MDI9940204.1 helix-turn-helix domain-containing protein [Rhodococcus sp. IEGM 1351]MDX5967699.1 helix-turn-helix domain-containing protein [Rhodococcus opacus]NKY76432.1 helix-turn-helix domain-containing protein [Rhodococcus opacus]QZS59134.1 helix-turn-helix domain-containing protein [Rhodococcus opacus]RKM74285.1 IclR family transcriptional regulator [Rhodococcus opacus]